MDKKCAAIAICLILAALAEICQAEEINLTNLLPLVTSEKSIGNTEYLFGGLSQRSDVKAFFSKLDAARESLIAQIKALPHSHNSLPCRISAEAESIMDFSLHQLVRVYLILDALKKGDLVNQIRKIISDYKEGDYYEPGGLGLLENGKILVEPRPSELFVKTPDIEGGYLISDKDFAMSHIFLFHMHPIGRGGPAPEPSWEPELKFAEDKEANIKYDIGVALARANEHGDYHHLLISKLGDGYFNVDYYVAEKIQPPLRHDPYQFCNKLTGFKIVDLGNWR